MFHVKHLVFEEYGKKKNPAFKAGFSINGEIFYLSETSVDDVEFRINCFSYISLYTV